MSLSLTQVAIKIPAAIDLFEKYGFDYYQNGATLLVKACEEKGLDVLKIEKELNKFKNSHTHPLYFEKHTIKDLLHVLTYEYYAKEKGIYHVLTDKIQNLLRIEAYPEHIRESLSSLERQFGRLTEHLLGHLAEEEKALSSYIEQLNQLQNERASSQEAMDTIMAQSPIPHLKSDQEDLVALLLKLKENQHGYETSPRFPSLYNSLLEELRDFEVELHLHLHLENNLLFPKCLVLEKEIRSKA